LCVRDMVISRQITGFEVESFDDMQEAYSLLTQKEFQEQYKWIFIDSLTEIASRCVEAMKKKYPKKADAFSLWGEYNDLMTKIIKDFRDISSYSVIFTCLPSTEKDENNKRYIAPAMSGASLKERLTSYFDEVFYMTVQKDDEGVNHRVFITQPYDRYPAKDRSGRLATIEKPDIEHIKNKIFKED